MASEAFNKMCKQFMFNVPSPEDAERIKNATSKGYYWTPARFREEVNKETRRHCERIYVELSSRMMATVLCAAFYALHLEYGWREKGLGRVYKRTCQIMEDLANPDRYGCRQYTFEDIAKELNKFQLDIDLAECRIADQNNQVLFKNDRRMYVGAVHEWLTVAGYTEAAEEFKEVFHELFR